MAQLVEPAPVRKRPAPRALPLLGLALGVAALAWAAAQVWRAQPAVAVSAQVAQIAAAATGPDPVEDAAFRVLRGRLREPASARFQDVRVYRFGPAQERAVCGRVLGARELPGGGVDFVVRVVLPGAGGGGGVPLPVIEEGPNLPRATANARHRYCRDASTPRTAPLLAGAFAATAEARAGGGAQSVAAQAGGGSPAAPRRVAVGHASPANLRGGPGGGSAVVGVVPRGQTLDVFERAPGGWLRVGVGEPWGWVHSSLLVGADN